MRMKRIFILLEIAEREREREREMTNVSKNILAASLLVLHASNRSNPKLR